MTEIFLTVLAPKRKVEYQKVPFSGHFSPRTLQKAKNITLRHYLSHNYAYFLYNNLYKKVAPHPRTRVKKALQKAHRRAQRKQGAHDHQKALQCATLSRTWQHCCSHRGCQIVLTVSVQTKHVFMPKDYISSQTFHKTNYYTYYAQKLLF